MTEKERITASEFEDIVQDGIANYMDAQGGTPEEWRPVVVAYLSDEYEIVEVSRG